MDPISLLLMAQSAVGAIRAGCQMLSEGKAEIGKFKKQVEGGVADAKAIYKEVTGIWDWIKSLLGAPQKPASSVVVQPKQVSDINVVDTTKSSKKTKQEPEQELSYEEFQARAVHDICENLKVYFEAMRHLKAHCRELDELALTTDKVADSAIDRIEIQWQMDQLSAQLKQFEETLGLQLFERNHKKLVLTEQGKVALDYAKNIFRMGSEMYEVLHDRLRPLKPTLHLGALDSVPKQIVIQLVKNAFKISTCQITLSEGKSDELLRELVAHRMDLMVTNFLPTGVDAKGLYPKAITKKNVAFFAAPKFKALRKGFPKSISGQPMIFPTYDSRLRQDLEHWAKLNEIDLNIITESQDIAVKKLIATEGLGLSPTATHTVTGQVLRGELIEIGQLQGVHEELFLITAQRKIENPIVAKLRDSFVV